MFNIFILGFLVSMLIKTIDVIVHEICRLNILFSKYDPNIPPHWMKADQSTQQSTNKLMDCS